MKYFVAVAAAVALAAPALAGGQGQEDPSKPSAEEVTDTSQNRMVCKRQKNTGSRLSSKRVCMTAAQWAQLEQDQRQAIERVQAGRMKSD